MRSSAVVLYIGLTFLAKTICVNILYSKITRKGGLTVE